MVKADTADGRGAVWQSSAMGAGTTAYFTALANDATTRLTPPPDGFAHGASAERHGIGTVAPCQRFSAALFVEKEGFDPRWESAGLRELFDIAIMSTKGMPVTAVRALAERFTAAGVPILVLHDFDKSGFAILNTLRNDTRRYKFKAASRVIDLGIGLADIHEHLGRKRACVCQRGARQCAGRRGARLARHGTRCAGARCTRPRCASSSAPAPVAPDAAPRAKPDPSASPAWSHRAARPSAPGSRTALCRSSRPRSPPGGTRTA